MELFKTWLRTTHPLLRRGRKGISWMKLDHLPKAGSINRLGVILLTKIQQVMHVEGAAGMHTSFCNLVVLLEPGEMKAWWENPSKKDLVFSVLLQSWAGLRNNSFYYRCENWDPGKQSNLPKVRHGVGRIRLLAPLGTTSGSLPMQIPNPFSAGSLTWLHSDESGSPQPKQWYRILQVPPFTQAGSTV